MSFPRLVGNYESVSLGLQRRLVEHRYESGNNKNQLMGEKVGFVIGHQKRFCLKIGNNAVECEIALPRNALCDGLNQITHFVETRKGFWLEWDSLDNIGDIKGYLLEACSQKVQVPFGIFIGRILAVWCRCECPYKLKLCGVD